jgi:hypothetical protein
VPSIPALINATYLVKYFPSVIHVVQNRPDPEIDPTLNRTALGERRYSFTRGLFLFAAYNLILSSGMLTFIGVRSLDLSRLMLLEMVLSLIFSGILAWLLHILTQKSGPSYDATVSLAVCIQSCSMSWFVGSLSAFLWVSFAKSPMIHMIVTQMTSRSLRVLQQPLLLLLLMQAVFLFIYLPRRMTRIQGVRTPRFLLWTISATAIGVHTTVSYALLDTSTAVLPIHTDPANRDWILLANFEGPASEFFRQRVWHSLTQSDFVIPLDDSDIKRELQNEGRPPDTTMTSDLAKEVATRLSVPIFLTGSVTQDPLEGTMLFTVTGIRTATGRTIFALSEYSQDAVLEDLHVSLGDNRKLFRATALRADAITPSFEAWQLYDSAANQNRNGHWKESIELAQEALQEDPHFALAWLLIATNEANLGRESMASTAYDSALALGSSRLTPGQIVEAKAQRALTVAHDYQSALNYLDEPSSDGYGYIRRLNDKADALYNLGRPDEALTVLMESRRKNPTSPGTASLVNELRCLVALGRFEKAAEVARELKSPRNKLAECYLALANSQWSQAESLASYLRLHEERLESYQITILRLAAASTAAARGRVKDARKEIGLAISQASAEWTSVGFSGLLHLLLVDSTTVLLLSSADSMTADGLVVHCAMAGIQGELTRARHWLGKFRNTASQGEQGRLKGDCQYLEALIAYDEADFESAVRILDPVAGGGGVRPNLISRLMMRLLLARAYEALGKRQAALAAINLAIAPIGLDLTEVLYRGITVPWAYCEATRLELALNQTEDARVQREQLRQNLAGADSVYIRRIMEMDRQF